MANKLELTWVGKENEIKIEPRILVENPALSNMSKNTAKVGQTSMFDEPTVDNFDNMLIHGDNLLALKALEAKYTGQIKCIYIDPPYNTGNAFDKYDDNLEHSIWLNLMNYRFKCLYGLLKKDGFLFVNLDEQEHAYAKVLLDSIFGRDNFIGDIIWQKRKGGGNDSHYLALDHDYILVYAKDASKETNPIKWRTAQSKEYLKRYKEIEADGRRYYWDTVARDGLQSPIPVSVDCPDGTTLNINSQIGQETINEGLKDGSIRLTKSKNGWTLHHKVYMGRGQVQRSILTDVGTNKTAGDEMEYLFGDKKAFPYPKPESLISRILELSTEEGDLVLDSFLGSGTTAAVAHKMNRKYIGIEMGDHAYTHCKKRLDKVVSGDDIGGISQELNWKGGGGYKFYELAPSLVVEDKYGNSIINKEYNADMLSAAMALHEGFTYEPDSNYYWKQGKNEKAYIFTTTNHITADYLASISSEMQEGEYLVIACKTFDCGVDKLYKNITIKKIPQVLLGRCEFGRDDYSLNIINVPTMEEEDEVE